MQIVIGQTVNVFNKFGGESIEVKVGVVENICPIPGMLYPILVKFNCGKSTWFNLYELSPHADS